MLRPSHLAFGLAATIASLPTLAAAQPSSGFYIGVGAGANFIPEQTGLTNRALAGQLRALNIPTTATVGSDPGFVGVVSVGYAFMERFRVELEGSYRQNEAGSTGSSTSTASGTGRAYGIMANALYDIRIPGVSWVVPYIGGGIGYAWRESDAGTLVDRSSGGTFITTGTQGSFAWQAIGGAAFPIPSVRGLSFTTEYRYFATQPEYFQTRGFNTRTGALVVSGATKSYGEAHSVLVGLRYALNTPAPAPVAAPAPAPAPARTFLVFFDWDRADLTDRARQIIAEAATNAATVRSTRIEVSGHADRTGTAAYNQRLSVRRAEAVAAELVRRGIARNEITIQGFGFDRPLVPTAMGVREPQNRRVEIVLR
ncbi:OmpA family protein [Sediminicoccus sp. KRV36]|uniref:OmpA family protein n=1 Tax=Sediminicoccus sp. KRV36 TaxID=3133721 RepID=UPI00200F38E5|nr:OmpA family protein [Sediminicoccus rosea]UPY36489.1 OmpA family protein [Sediminicoccus rosea]